MKYFTQDPYGDSMTDDEFFKLMGAENMVEANQKYHLEKEKEKEKVTVALQPLQKNNPIINNWLPITIFATLTILLFL